MKVRRFSRAAAWRPVAHRGRADGGRRRRRERRPRERRGGVGPLGAERGDGLRAREPGGLRGGGSQARLSPDADGRRRRRVHGEPRLHGRRGPDRGRRRPRRLEQPLRPRLRPRLRRADRDRHLHGRGLRSGERRLATVRHRQRHGRLRPGARQRPALLPHRTRRALLLPVEAAHRGRASERRSRHDLQHAARERRRHLRRRPEPPRPEDRRLGRLVGRRRLPQVPAHDDLRRGAHAGRRARLSGGDGHAFVVQLLRRGPVRRRVAAAHVGRPHPDALLPGRHRQRQRAHRRRPRHLAPAAARRHLARGRSGLPLHPSPAGVPGRPARFADQPQPRRP